MKTLFQAVKAIDQKGDRIEAWLFSHRLLGISLYWWVVAGLLVFLASQLLTLDALVYENKAEII